MNELRFLQQYCRSQGRIMFCFHSSRDSVLLFLFTVCAIIISINSQPESPMYNWHRCDPIQMPLIKQPTLLTHQISQPFWILCRTKLPKTLASTTTLLMASTASSSAEVMFLMIPAIAVSDMRVKTLQVSVHPTQMRSSGSINVC